MDDWGRLLSGCGANNSTQGSNPCLPARFETSMLVAGYWMALWYPACALRPFSGGGRVFLWGVVGTAEGAEAAVGTITGLDGGHLAGHTLSGFSGVQPVQRFGAMQGGRFLDSTPHRCIPPRPARGRLLLRNFIAVSCSLNSARGAVGLLEMTGVVGLIFALGAFHIGGESSRKLGQGSTMPKMPPEAPQCLSASPVELSGRWLAPRVKYTPLRLSSCAISVMGLE